MFTEFFLPPPQKSPRKQPALLSLVELQNGMTISIVIADGSLKVHLIQSLAVLTVYGGEGFLISGDGTHIKT
ncbi:hypothetical protein QL285_026666 [Trifolium repens]|nr:hypothetical protein QL285_026666 [Trifolium repens]